MISTAGPAPGTGWEPVDRHDPPEAMREVVILRDRECVAPGRHCSSRWAHLDFIDPYVLLDDSGPPGQTHHRFKTFTAWTYRRAPDGTCAWFRH